MFHIIIFVVIEMKKRLFIFDCFGVIFGEIGPRIVRKYAGHNDISELKDKLFVPADLGQITYDELLTSIADEFGVDKQTVADDWNSFVVLNEELVEMIKVIRENACVALLSNASKGFVESLFEKFGLTHLFDKMVISCNVGMAKPDTKIYRYCVSLFDNDFDEIYMVDDNIANVRAAAALGIIPIHFTGNECVRELVDKF